MQMAAKTRPEGELGLRVIRGMDYGPKNPPPRPVLTSPGILVAAQPKKGLPDEVNAFREENRVLVARALVKFGPARWFARKMGLPFIWSELYGRVFKADGRVHDYGLLGLKVVTTAGVNAIVDAFQNTVELETFNYHGIGTGGTAEAVGDTALVTELTTQYSTDNTRDTGTQGEGASANIYQSVGLNPVDASVAIVEHGLFTQAATGGGTLLDRTVFTVINLASGDSLETTYEITFTSGG